MPGPCLQRRCPPRSESSVPRNLREPVTAEPGRVAPPKCRRCRAARPVVRRLTETAARGTQPAPPRRRRAPEGHGRQGGGGARRSPAAAPPPSSGMSGCLRARQERWGAEKRSGPQRVSEPAASSPARRLPRAAARLRLPRSRRAEEVRHAPGPALGAGEGSGGFPVSGRGGAGAGGAGLRPPAWRRSPR